MNINEFDNTIDNASLITKVDNLYIMLYTSIMERDLSRVDHKISDIVYNKYQSIVDELKNNKEVQMYGELNVKGTSIDNIYLDHQGNIVVEVTLISRYLDYVNDEDGNYLRGDKNNRKEFTNKMTLIKSKDAVELTSARKCPGCNHTMDISYNGKCDYCGRIFNLEKYDYILYDISVL